MYISYITILAQFCLTFFSLHDLGCISKCAQVRCRGFIVPQFYFRYLSFNRNMLNCDHLSHTFWSSIPTRMTFRDRPREWKLDLCQVMRKKDHRIRSRSARNYFSWSFRPDDGTMTAGRHLNWNEVGGRMEIDFYRDFAKVVVPQKKIPTEFSAFFRQSLRGPTSTKAYGWFRSSQRSCQFVRSLGCWQ